MPVKSSFSNLSPIGSVTFAGSEVVGLEAKSASHFSGVVRDTGVRNNIAYSEIPARALDDIERTDEQEYFNLDPQIKELKRKMIPKTAVNKAFLFFNDETAIMTVNSISNAVRGKGIRVESENAVAKFLLEEFYKNLNGIEDLHERYSVGDLIRDVFMDNSVHGEALFMKRITTDRLTIHRLDPKSCYPVSHDFFGWRKYVQRTYVSPDLPGVVKGTPQESEVAARGYPAVKVADTESEITKARKDFYSNQYEPHAANWFYDRRVMDKVYPHSIHIPDYKLYIFNLYRKSLVDPILEVLLYKKFMLFYLRKAAEKYAGPLLVFEVGTESSHPTDRKAYETMLEKYSLLGATSRFGDSIAVPFNVRVNPIDTSSRQMDITRQLEFVNKLIVQALGSSMALYDASGSELATSSTNLEVWLRNIASHRDKLQGLLQQMGEDYLETCESDYADISEAEFTVTWAPLQKEQADRLIRSLIDLYNSGIISQEEALDVIRGEGVIDLKPRSDKEKSDESDESTKTAAFTEKKRSPSKGFISRFEDTQDMQMPWISENDWKQMCRFADEIDDPARTVYEGNLEVTEDD